MPSGLPNRKIGNVSVPPIRFGMMGISRGYGQVGTDEKRLQTLRTWEDARTGARLICLVIPKSSLGNVESVDLCYVHRTDTKVHIEITIGMMAELVKERKIKYLGLSERTAKTLRRAHTVHPISTIQMGFSPFVLDVSDPQLELLKTSRELGVRIVCYSPLGRGLYTGKCKSIEGFETGDFRRTVPKYSGRDWPRILNVVSQLGKIGAAHNATSAQITLTWLLTQGDDFLVTPGMRKIHYLGGNLGAAPVHLTKEEVDSITKIANETEMPGARYGAWHSAQVYV